MHVVAHAPVRTADLGGWTDTWFATSGKVCNVAVEPGVSVRLQLADETNERPNVTLLVGRERQEFELGLSGCPDGADRLVVAALQQVRPASDLVVSISSGVPAGSGLGTSAAVAVALLAGLYALRGPVPDQSLLATLAHTVETSLGLQSGIQDQFGSAFGGTHLFDIAYPGLVEAPIRVDHANVSVLGQSLITVYLGRPHRSSELHDQVIASLEAGSNEARLGPLRQAAVDGFEALQACDIDAYGRAMRSNHEAQKRLHPALVSAEAARVIDVARSCGARGWKVNGAGGEGGSLCLLAPTSPALRAQMLEAVSSVDDIEILDLRVASDGVTARRM